MSDVELAVWVLIAWQCVITVLVIRKARTGPLGYTGAMGVQGPPGPAGMTGPAPTDEQVETAVRKVLKEYEL